MPGSLLFPYHLQRACLPLLATLCMALACAALHLKGAGCF